MRGLLLASAMLSLVGGHALAADAIGAEPTTVHDWSGVYAGGHLGYGFGRSDAVFSLPNTPTFQASQDYDIDGFLGGVQVGYNYQINSVVLGVEADIAGADIKGDSNEINVGVRGDTYDTKVDWFGTLRARPAMRSIAPWSTGPVAWRSGASKTGISTAPSTAFPRRTPRLAGPSAPAWSKRSPTIGPRKSNICMSICETRPSTTAAATPCSTIRSMQSRSA